MGAPPCLTGRRAESRAATAAMLTPCASGGVNAYDPVTAPTSQPRP
jgi:hypothetical protein